MASACLYLFFAKPNLIVNTDLLIILGNYFSLICKAEILYPPQLYLKRSILIQDPWLLPTVKYGWVICKWPPVFSFVKYIQQQIFLFSLVQGQFQSLLDTTLHLYSQSRTASSENKIKFFKNQIFAKFSMFQSQIPNNFSLLNYIFWRCI